MNVEALFDSYISIYQSFFLYKFHYCALSATRAKFHTSASPMIERGYPPNTVSESDTVQQIIKPKNSAAGILYELITRHVTKACQDLKNCGVVGIVATLGKVDDGNISRLVFFFFLYKINFSLINCIICYFSFPCRQCFKFL